MNQSQTMKLTLQMKVIAKLYPTTKENGRTNLKQVIKKKLILDVLHAAEWITILLTAP